jgi:beta-carotene 15,15'-dioxygenase
MTHRFFLLFTGLLSLCCLLAHPIELMGSVLHVTLASLMVILVGIPHGAIDHKISQSPLNHSIQKFYLLYFLSMGIGLGLWFIFPKLSFLLFLLLSAFHFGQSQFATFKFGTILRNTLYISWGLSLLAGIIIYRFAELTNLANEYADLAIIHSSLNYLVFTYILLFSTASTLFIFLLSLIAGSWDLKIFLKEIILFVLLHCTFFLLPFVLGFIMYFTVFHSLSVLGQEFDYLKSQLKIQSIKQFIGLLAPFTLLSLVGLCLGGLAVYFQLISISYIFLLIIFISVLTIPHSFVMDTFYRRLKI